MQEVVQFDLRGEQTLEFDDNALTYVARGYSALSFRRKVAGRRVIVNTQLPYSQIQWIGVIRRRQAWALVLGFPFGLLGLILMSINFGQWGPFAASSMFFILLGVVPLVIFLRGRAWLGIASVTQIIIVPLDLPFRKVRRVLGLLNQFCPRSSVQWALPDTPKWNPKNWDEAPPTGKSFNLFRYLLISQVIGFWACLNLLRTIGRTYSIAAYGLKGLAIILFVGIVGTLVDLWYRARNSQ